MMKKFTRSLALALLIPAAVAGAVKNPDTLVNAEIGGITSLDPVFPYDDASQGLIYNIYDTLIAFDGASLTRFRPALSTAVPSRANGLISSDGRTYRFPIRKGVFFQDGQALTPKDARYSLLRFMLTDRAGGPSALLLEPILGVASTRDASGKIAADYKKAAAAVRVRGDDLVIHLARPFAPFLSIMARWSYVESESWAAAHGEWDGSEKTWKKYNDPGDGQSYFNAHADASGPFELERWDFSGKFALLARNPRYWRGPAALARVVVKTVPELSTRKLMLEAGDADIIEVPAPLASEIQGMPGVRLEEGRPRLSVDPAFFFTFRINASANPDIGSGRLDGNGIPPDFFTDKDLRKAFAYSFNYAALVQDVFHGKAQAAVGPIPPGILGYDPRGPRYRYDPARAAAEFKKAWGGQVWQKGFRFTLTYNTGGESRLAACEILKRGVEAINPKFRVDLRGLDWPSYLARAQQRLLPVFSRGWSGDYPDPHDFVFAFYDSQGRYPSAQGYSNPAMDALIKGAARESSPSKRAVLYRRILRLGYEDEPSIVTVYPKGVLVMRDWVHGYVDNPIFLDAYYYPISKQ
ncbi:MAG: ABC transporter substrate-binding protein [Elusimicrobiota bacterium]